jgi:transposase
LVPEFEAVKKAFGINFIFMQDNAPCHKTHKVMSFLERKRIPTLDWPPQSPDLNPIENIWDIIRRYKKFGFPRSKVELI